MLVASDVSHTYVVGSVPTPALTGLSYSFQMGSFTAIFGDVGSGKSTLLHCLTGLLKPTEGYVMLDGQDLAELSQVQLDHLHRDDFGFISQHCSLIDTLTVEQNVMFPGGFGAGLVSKPAAHEALARVGLMGKETTHPTELSAGDQQCVAVARALARPRRVLFTDEPTGSLGDGDAARVMKLFTEFIADGTTVVMVTQDQAATEYADHMLHLAAGTLVEAEDQQGAAAHRAAAIAQAS